MAFLFKAGHRSGAGTDHVLPVRLFMGGHLGCSHVLAVADPVAGNTPSLFANVSLRPCFQSHGDMPAAQLLDPMVIRV